VNDQVKQLGLRLASALGFEVSPEDFSDDVAWALFARLELCANERRHLDATVLRVIEDLSIVLHVSGGDEALFLRALEGQLGPSPFPVETIIAIVKYVRGQLHDFSARVNKVQLDDVRQAWVPHKNLDFE
jgi:hypothetical protein